jgi:hypothetical protein
MASTTIVYNEAQLAAWDGVSNLQVNASFTISTATASSFPLRITASSNIAIQSDPSSSINYVISIHTSSTTSWSGLFSIRTTRIVSIFNLSFECVSANLIQGNSLIVAWAASSGYNPNVSFSQCSVVVNNDPINITYPPQKWGGFVGNLDTQLVGSVISFFNCTYSGFSTGDSGCLVSQGYTGGGTTYSCTITVSQCFIEMIMPTGLSTNRIAGIMGSQSRLHHVSISDTIVNIHNIGNLSSNDQIGGFIGNAADGYNITNSYVVVTAISGSCIIDFICINYNGIRASTVSNCYFVSVIQNFTFYNLQGNGSLTTLLNCAFQNGTMNIGVNPASSNNIYTYTSTTNTASQPFTSWSHSVWSNLNTSTPPILSVFTISPFGGYTTASSIPVLTSVVVSGLSPSNGAIGGGTSIDITGSGFTSNITSILFGSVVATSYTFNNQNSITVVSPASTSAGSVDVVISIDTVPSNATSYYYGNPVLSSLSPPNGSLHGGTTVTIRGSGFTVSSLSTVTILFGNTPVTSYAFLDDTTMTVTSPASTSAGSVDVTVSIDGVVSNAVSFSYGSMITSISPSYGSINGGTSVTISGNGFTSNITSILFGSSPATDVVFINDTTLTAVSPSASTGSVDVTVNIGGVLSNAVGYYYGTPVITSISPTNGSVGGGTAVTLRGSGFIRSSASTLRIFFGNTSVSSYTLVNDTTITTTTPVASTSGSVDVTVSIDDAISNAVTYYYGNPTINSLSPTNGSIGGGTSVTISGTGFTSDITNLLFGSLPATNIVIVNATTITAVSPSASATGSVNVTVSISGAISNVVTYYYGNPTISSISPTNGSIGGGTSVTIRGTGFTSNITSLLFGIISATNIVFVNTTTITARSPAASISGSVDVTLSINGAMSNAVTYYYGNPTISSLSPTNGSIGGGTSVTITGTGFTSTDTSVLFGSTSATNVVFINTTTLTAVSPSASASGSVDVTVVINGSISNAVGYYYGNPVITNLSPSSGSIGMPITIGGSGFTLSSGSTIIVLFGNTPATDVVVNNNNSISAKIPEVSTVEIVYVTVSIDGSISNAVAFDFVIPCLCRGMKIDTPHGPQPIESLKEGDLVLVPPFRYRTVPIRRIFSSTYVGTLRTVPLHIPYSFFEENIPNKDILISPNHLLFYNSQWRLPIQIEGLKQETDLLGKKFEYYHIQLPNYCEDKLWCHNLPVDSWHGKNPLEYEQS